MSLFSGMSADKSADASADALCIIIPHYLFPGTKDQSINQFKKKSLPG